MIANIAMGAVFAGIFVLAGILFYAVSDDDKTIQKFPKTK